MMLNHHPSPLAHPPTYREKNHPFVLSVNNMRPIRAFLSIMKATNYILIITAILVILFFLTGMEKVWYHTIFRIQLYKQPLPGWTKDVLEWGLPLGELAVVGLLVYWRTMRWGLWVSAVMLLAFAAYTFYAASAPDGHPVCACGKLFSGLSWTAHFWVNMGLAAMAVAGALLHQRSAKTSKRTEAAAVG